MPFSNEEKRDMMQMYYRCNRQVRNTSVAYLEAYPERRQPNETYFLKLHKRLSEDGSFCKNRTNYGSRISQENRDAILQAVYFLYFLLFFNMSVLNFRLITTHYCRPEKFLAI